MVAWSRRDKFLELGKLVQLTHTAEVLKQHSLGLLRKVDFAPKESLFSLRSLGEKLVPGAGRCSGD